MMKYRSWRCLGLLAPVLFLVAAANIEGQAIQSTILGKVTDPSGAAVANAAVAIKNEGTNFERTMQTDENGDYRIAGLGVGNYQVSVSAPGFKSFVRSPIVLDSSQIKRVDANLELAEATSTVTVTGDIGQLETETASLSNVKTA